MSHPTFRNDDKLREACRNRCAEFGDPACWEIDPRGRADTPPCGECLRDVGVEPGDEFDEGAALRRLL